MALSMKRRSQQIAANQLEYQERYQALTFLPKEELQAAQRQREELLEALRHQAEIGCHGSKLDMRRLSPGCRICVDGGWSCLFINGRCNCDCFYCPTTQDEIGLPTTNTVTFRHPADYVRYLERLDFTGASISGGEPLLTPNRSLGFLSAIKRHFGSSMHTWLYTNGTLLNEDLLDRLGDAGLDEIRFDIGATDYNLKPLLQAVGKIPTVTVEIPAIPEELPQLKILLRQLHDSGVDHFNLHQLRLTPYNYHHLVKRNYRFLHGEKVTILDSELAALQLLQYSFEQEIELPINYCSFVYKNRFQARSARLRNGLYQRKSYEELTDNGFLRTLTLHGSKQQLTALQEHFSSHWQSTTLWLPSRSGEQLTIHPSLWPLVDLSGLRLTIAYSSARQLSTVSYRNPFISIELSERQKLIIERGKVCSDLELSADQAELFGRVFLLGRSNSSQLPDDDLWEEILLRERVTEGLQEYF